MVEKISYYGWPDCIRIYNEEIELIVTTAIGPRIVKFGYIGGQNFFYLVPGHIGKIGGNEWRIYGGHRLWHAPEAMPRSYNPDNEKVEFIIDAGNNIIKLAQASEAFTGITKELEISLEADKNEVTIVHRLINQNLWEIELSVWPLSMLAPGGRAIIPQEPYGSESEFLLPARSLALWQFTKMNDPRWIWGEKYIQARQDPAFTSEQKIGVTNKQGWAAYYLNGEVLIKRFDYNPEAEYVDYGCNNEVFVNGDFLEVETLGPLTKLAPGKAAEHTERWLLAKTLIDESDESVDANILPLINSFNL
ncbi:MAG: hypothetical protein JST21_18830 [Bacteroidetes bacterium]|nr:hypothetical protein [Bacteroidota bacterium]MBS1748220.1 hypothetical protein [Bacteroidota bacterium]